MKKWLLRIVYFCVALLPVAVYADYTATQGAGSTVFAFVCSTTKICPATVLIDSSNVEKGTGANPVRTDPTGTTTQPISAASLPLPASAATSTNQTNGTQKSQVVDGSGNVQPSGDAAARAIFQKVTDGTNTAAVKAASTAAAAADPSVVTNESPNSQISTATGTTADAAYSGSGSGTLVAIMKWIGATLVSINTNIQAAIAAGTNYIGQVGIDPSQGGATPTTTFLALPATTTTQIVALSGSTKTYVTSRLVFAGGTVNVTFKYGTGSNCGTGTTTLDGPYPVKDQSGFSEGNGSGAVLIVPSGQALCITTDASVSGGVKLTYQQK